MTTARKSLLFIVMPLLLSIDLHAQSLSGWKLVWSDEFTGTSIDTSKWALELNEGNPGIAVYTNRPQNVFVQNGSLALQAQKEYYGGKQYTSTQLSTRNKGFWRCCRVDVRARLPHGQGMWPAIWMMPQSPAYGGWPRSGEIDIMENLGNDTKLLYTTIHYGASNQSSGGTYATGSTHTLSDTFHVYTMIWDSGSLSFYLDSTHNYYNLTSWSPDNVSFPKPFDQPFFLILDLAVGGSWPGNPDSTTVFPQGMLVDWVHVYQRQSSSGAMPSPRARVADDISVDAAGNVVTYTTRTGADVKVELCTVAGRRLATLVDGYQSAGRHRLDIPVAVGGSGVYLCRLEVGATRESRRVCMAR